MTTVIVQLKDILTDPDRPVDLSTLPEAEAIEQIRRIYGFFGPLLEVTLDNGIAVITLPEAELRKVNQALDKLQQASRTASRGRYQQAITLYQEVLKLLPLHTGARRELGMAYMELGNMRAAKQELIRTLQLDPKDAGAYLILGNLYFQAEQDLGSAERYYILALEYAPDNSYVLTSYGSLLAKRGKFDEARSMFERALAVAPENPTPRVNLALLMQRQGELDAAITTLEALFVQPASADPRNQVVLTEGRRLYVELRRARATLHQRVNAARLQEAFDDYKAATGIGIRVVNDPSIKTSAKVEMAWQHNRAEHVIRIAGSGLAEAWLAHEFVHILMIDEARAAGRNRLFATSPELEERAIKTIEKDLRRLRGQRGFTPDVIDEYARQLVQGLALLALNMPLDCFIEQGVYDRFPWLHDTQFVTLADQMTDYQQIVTEAEIRTMTPTRIWQANVAMSTAFALFADALFGGMTAYAESYRPTGMFGVGERLYALYQQVATDRQPGQEYKLVDLWAQELRLTDWFVWRADTEAEQAAATSDTGSDADFTDVGHRPPEHGRAIREGGATNPDYLKRPEVQINASFYMRDALERFEGMTRQQILEFAGEIAILGMGGISYIAGEETYTLRSSPGETFSGLHLLCLEYVGFKLVDPSIDLQVPLAPAYEMALSLYNAGKDV